MALINTPVCTVGWEAKNFELVGTDDNIYKMEEQMGSGGLLIAFICNHCPYVKAVIARFVQDAEVLMANGVNILTIMSNDYDAYPDDSTERMKLFAIEHGFNFPYLIDKTQEVAKDYGAVCTPDFFGFNNKFQLQYRGRIDNAKMGDPAGRIPELLNAMLEIASTGRCTQNQQPSIGCSIKWR